MQTYEKDIIAWANEQARLLRSGHFDQLDIEHIAEEIEDVGKSEQRELASRMSVLLAHLYSGPRSQDKNGVCLSWALDFSSNWTALPRFCLCFGLCCCCGSCFFGGRNP